MIFDWGFPQIIIRQKNTILEPQRTPSEINANTCIYTYTHTTYIQAYQFQITKRKDQERKKNT